MKKKLPTIGTSAASTAFCAAHVNGPGGLYLWVDGNGKITRSQGDLEHPVPNAFSLLSQGVEDKAGRPGTHCPGATPTCVASCYVDGLAKHAAETYALYDHNSRTIRAILANKCLADEWVLRFADWVDENCDTFRWHVSGDVFSGEYAAWIADVCREAPHVEFWIYTRSLDHLAQLAVASTLRGGNLSINVSCDADNYEDAAEASYVHGTDVVVEVHQPTGLNLIRRERLRLCYLTSDGQVPHDLPDGSVIFPDYALRGGTDAGRAWFAGLDADYKSYVCPVDYNGKSEVRRCGPCARCLT